MTQWALIVFILCVIAYVAATLRDLEALKEDG